MTFKIATEWRDVAVYFAVVLLLTIPFWIASAVVPARLMPGLSIAALAVVVPTISACVVAAAGDRWRSVRRLFASLGARGRHELIAALLAVAVPLAVALLSWTLAEPQDKALLPGGQLFALVPIFLIAAVLEEIGWSAFAAARLHYRLGTMLTGIVVGLGWAIWHLPSLVELGHTAEWIAWWSIWTIAQRIIMVRLYIWSGLWIWGPVVFHATSNILWQVAPDAYDPQVEALTMVAFAVVAAWADRK